MLGGFVATHYLSDASNVAINPKTIEQLQTMNIDAPNGKLMPDALFSNQVFESPKSILILIIAGIMIGFGSRYAGGCTSGHAISDLSNLQLPSLKAVIGFFIGGLIKVPIKAPNKTKITLVKPAPTRINIGPGQDPAKAHPNPKMIPPTI